MPFNSFLQITLNSVLKVKWRLVRIILLFAIGTAAIFFMMTYSNTIRVETFRRFHSEGMDLFSVIKRPGTGALGRGQFRRLTPEAVSYLKYDPDYILETAAEFQLSESITFNDMTFGAFISGVQESFFNALNLKLHSGRRLSRFDEGRAFCLLGYRVYQRLRERFSDTILNKPIHLGHNVFKIVGILAPCKSTTSEYSIDEAVFVPYSTLSQYLASAEITKITLKANPNRPIPDVTDYIHSSLERYLGDASIYEINNQHIFLQSIVDQANQISFIFGVIGSISLILGSISLLKLIIFINFDRDHTFKLLSDTGVKIGYLRLQLILEPLLVALLGGALGVVIGLVAAEVVIGHQNWIPVISANTHILCLAAASVLGLLIGLYPALSITRAPR
ncbi:ABC transporter permease [candidate division KSB1 bacterium]|nr:ABC transporter permease [candidate division KSB1 bacterium]